MIKSFFKLEWGSHKLFMSHYPIMKQMQFDMSSTNGQYVTSNISVEEAKLIRDRLNKFIKECESQQNKKTFLAQKEWISEVQILGGIILVLV